MKRWLVGMALVGVMGVACWGGRPEGVSYWAWQDWLEMSGRSQERVCWSLSKGLPVMYKGSRLVLCEQAFPQFTYPE